MLTKKQIEVRNKRILKGYTKEKKTLDMIGREEHLTRERCRQILNKFPEQYFGYKKTHKVNVEHPAEIFKSKCGNCGKKLETKQVIRKFCSVKCRKSYTDSLHARKFRKCSGCGKVKSRTEFYPDYDKKDFERGFLSPRCKKCTYGSNLSWRVRNPEAWSKIVAKAHKVWLSKPGNKERVYARLKWKYQHDKEFHQKMNEAHRIRFNDRYKNDKAFREKNIRKSHLRYIRKKHGANNR